MSAATQLPSWLERYWIVCGARLDRDEAALGSPGDTRKVSSSKPDRPERARILSIDSPEEAFALLRGAAPPPPAAKLRECPGLDVFNKPVALRRRAFRDEEWRALTAELYALALTEKEWLFVRVYLECGTGSEAAVALGYSNKRSAATKAWQFLKREYIQMAVRLLRTLPPPCLTPAVAAAAPLSVASSAYVTCSAVEPEPEPTAPLDRPSESKEEKEGGALFDEMLKLTMEAYENNSSRTSIHTYRWHAANARKWFGGRFLHDIRRADIQRLVWQRKKEGVSPATISHDISFIARVFETAIDLELVDTNPCRRVKKPQINNKREAILTEADEVAWRALMTPQEWSLVEFAFNTGVRRLEQFRLRQADIQFSERVIDGLTVRLGVAHIRDSKTGKSRTLALNVRASAIAQEWIDTNAGAEWLFLPGANGGLMKRLNIASKTTQRLLGLGRKQGLIKGLVWHSLRHTAACRALHAGASLREVQRFLGHSSVTMTERYLHWTHDDTWTAALALDSAGSKAAPQ